MIVPRKRVGELTHAFLVGSTDDQRTDTVVHHLAHRDDLARALGVAGEHDVEALVEDDLRTAVEDLVVDVGVQRDPHLATRGEHVDRAVVVLADDDAVGRRRLRQLVDLVAQRADVLARLAQRVGQLLVLGNRFGQLALRLEQPLLERADPTRRIGESRPEMVDFLAECLDLLDELGVGRHGLKVHRERVIVFARAWPCKLVTGRNPPATFHEGATTDMKVWIDQDLCTGDGLCEEIAPDVFTLLDDGLAYVVEGDKIFAEAKGNPQGAEGLAEFPDNQLDAVVESAEECPGECIYIEP